MGGDQLSIKELTKELASIKSTVQEHQKRLLAMEAECCQLKKEQSTSNEKHQQQVSKLDKTIETLESHQSAEKMKMMELHDFIINLSPEKKEVKQLQDFIYGNQDDIFSYIARSNHVTAMLKLIRSRNTELPIVLNPSFDLNLRTLPYRYPRI